MTLRFSSPDDPAIPNERTRASIRRAMGVAELPTPEPVEAPRQRRGVPNKTEQRRIEYWQAQGRRVLFEAMKFRLADEAWYTPDLVVLTHGEGGVQVIEEVKGKVIREAAMVRFKVAAEQYPMFAWRMVKWTNGTWEIVRES